MPVSARHHLNHLKKEATRQALVVSSIPRHVTYVILGQAMIA